LDYTDVWLTDEGVKNKIARDHPQRYGK